MDSVALFHLCLDLRPKYKIFAVHVNHNLREKSKYDQLFVEKLCLEHNVPLLIRNAHPKIKKNESIEMWARRIRYNAFSEVKEEFCCDYIFTAHHANDLVETEIMHLNDGCGIEGLRGIPKINIPYIRPLLAYPKSSIKKYIFKNNINFILDETNDDISIKRNFIRKQIVSPWVKQTNNLIDRFISLSSRATNTINYINTILDEFSKYLKVDKNQILIPKELTRQILPSQFARLVKRLIGEESIPWRRHKWELFIQWSSTAKTGSKYSINDCWKILCDRENFIINNQFTDNLEISIESRGHYKFGSGCLKIDKTDKMLKNNNPLVEIIDWGLVSKKELKLRTWKNGDRFKPLGMKGNKKISDLLIDKKMNRFDKEKQLVLTADDEIIWVCGQQISDSVKVTSKTSDFMKLSIAF